MTRAQFDATVPADIPGWTHWSAGDALPSTRDIAQQLGLPAGELVRERWFTRGRLRLGLESSIDPDGKWRIHVSLSVQGPAGPARASTQDVERLAKDLPGIFAGPFDRMDVPWKGPVRHWEFTGVTVQ